MTESTFNRRLSQLIAQVQDHPHREEILQLALEQLSDDSDSVLEQLY
jgi:hypothetical protein